MSNYYTEQTNFYGQQTPQELIACFGSPLYVYNERILRERCREMLRFVDYPRIRVNYSIKANSNIELIRIAREEGLCADAMSPGEIAMIQAAGYSTDEIFFIPNNISEEEMRFALDRGILISVDSLSQLHLLGRINPGGRVAVRFNPGIGAGHHDKVIAGGKRSKFGVTHDCITEVKDAVKRYGLKLVGINQHIGSLFEPEPYLAAVHSLLSIAAQFEDLEFVDLGGGFSVPYRKQEGQKRFPLDILGNQLGPLLNRWVADYGKEVLFIIEPGRYIAAECGVLLGTVNAHKENYSVKYAGTDLGFNLLMRPVLYDAYHELEVYPVDNETIINRPIETVTVVGNICEPGDIIAADRLLPRLNEGDVLGVMDAGAYGFSMSSNYNCRLRPAEILIEQDGNARLIKRRETIEDLLKTFQV
jgi:diaminopimelate decarboxylase